MQDLSSKLRQMMTELELYRNTVIKELDRCPEGRMIRTRSQGRPIIMRIRGIGAERKRESITKDHDMQVKIARRSLLEKELQTANAQIEALRKAEETIAKNCLPDRRRYIIENYGWLTDEEIEVCCYPAYGSDWENAPYEKLQYHAEELKHVTSHGLRVRSKSELLIAEALYKHGLPFRYEQVYRIEKYTVSADFTIKRSDGKIIIWEHEGLINTRSYLDWQRKKAEIYAMLGFYPWDNLVITYDTADGNIDLRIVESEIRNRLLI